VTKTQKQLQSEQTRQRIIEAATQAFARKGFYGTSISDLAEATDLTKGALYHHFESKDALFYAVLDAVRRAWHQRVLRDVLKSKGALTRLSVLFDNHVAMIAQDEAVCLVMNSLLDEMEGVNLTFVEALHEVYADLAYVITGIVRKGQAAGEIRSDLDAEMIALNVLSALRGTCSRLLNKINPDDTARLQTLKQMLLDSLKP